LQVSLHLICVRDEVDRAWPSRPHQQGQPSTDVHPIRDGQQIMHVASPFLSNDILEVIGSILRPGTGAPPDLPAQIDSVSSVMRTFHIVDAVSCEMKQLRMLLLTDNAM